MGDGFFGFPGIVRTIRQILWADIEDKPATFPPETHTHDYAASDHTHSGASRIVGEVIMWPTNTAPSGWLLCYGQAISRTTYSALFSAISTVFGVGNGSTTFNLPDFRGRFPLGQDDMGGSSANRVTAAAADSIGGNSGTETVTLTQDELPSHYHGINCVRDPQSGSGGYNPEIKTQTATAYTKNTNSAGGGDAHSNMPPYLTVNFIIYTGV